MVQGEHAMDKSGYVPDDESLTTTEGPLLDTCMGAVWDDGLVL